MEHRLGEESVRFDEVCVVADRKSFSLLVECIKGNGYHFTAHPDWNVPLRPSFQEALDFSNVRSDARRSLAKPAFPGGMGILPPVQAFRLPEYAGRRGEARMDTPLAGGSGYRRIVHRMDQSASQASSGPRMRG